MNRKYEAKIYKSDDPLLERSRVFEATCFEEHPAKMHIADVLLVVAYTVPAVCLLYTSPSPRDRG